MNEELEVGQLVVSTAGRDEGHVYVVVGSESSGTVLVADGRRRTKERPKRKNPRHLKATGESTKVLGAGRITNEKIRAAIEISSGGEGGAR